MALVIAKVKVSCAAALFGKAVGSLLNVIGRFEMPFHYYFTTWLHPFSTHEQNGSSSNSSRVYSSDEVDKIRAQYNQEIQDIKLDYQSRLLAKDRDWDKKVGYALTGNNC